jgi:hypothetical protein
MVTDRKQPARGAPAILGICLGLAVLVGCDTFDRPRIVAGDAKTVSVVSGWFIPDWVAQGFCETHGKRAIYQSSEATSPDSDRRIHYFICEDPVRE